MATKTLVDKVKEKALCRKMDNQTYLSFNDFDDFLKDHDAFINNEFKDIQTAINYRKVPPSASINKLFSLNERLSVLFDQLEGEYTDGIFIYYADLLEEIDDVYDTLINSFYLMGYSDGEGFSIQTNYVEYTIKQHDTIAQIAKQFYNDRNQTQRILEANKWLTTTAPEDYKYKTILVPVDSIQKTAISSNLGKASWGADFPKELTVDETGDLKVLSFKDSFVQDILNIACYGIRSVPEDPSVGNAFLNEIGHNYVTLNTLIASDALRKALLSDEAVDSVVISNIAVQEDAFTAKVIVRPINSEEVYSIDL